MLTARFNAAFVNAPSPQNQSPIPRVPPKQAPAMNMRLSNLSKNSSPHKIKFGGAFIRDVTNNQDLGAIVDSVSVGMNKMRITTTRTTIYINIKSNRVVRGRVGNRALYGAHVIEIDPFAD